MNKDDLDNFISGMKAREDEERRLHEEHLVRATLIQAERMKLESFRYKCEERDKRNDDRLRSVLLGGDQ